MANLVTLEEFKSYKKISKTENDEVLNQLITAVSDMVKTYCGHTFIDYYGTNKVETFNVNQSQDAIFLSEWPVYQLVSVETRDSHLDTYTVIDTTEYFLNTSIDTLFKHVGYWPCGFGAVKVTYKGGYSTAPSEVKLATLDLINHYFKEEYKQRMTIGQATIDNAPSNSNSSRWPPHIQRVLDFYRNV